MAQHWKKVVKKKNLEIGAFTVSGAMLGGLAAGTGGAILGSGIGLIYDNLDKRKWKKNLKK